LEATATIQQKKANWSTFIAKQALDTMFEVENFFVRNKTAYKEMDGLSNSRQEIFEGQGTTKSNSSN